MFPAIVTRAKVKCNHHPHHHVLGAMICVAYVQNVLVLFSIHFQRCDAWCHNWQKSCNSALMRNHIYREENKRRQFKVQKKFLKSFFVQYVTKHFYKVKLVPFLLMLATDVIFLSCISSHPGNNCCSVVKPWLIQTNQYQLQTVFFG